MDAEVTNALRRKVLQGRIDQLTARRRSVDSEPCG
jgi:hypothetical protein